jgi:DNA mismatch repair protein MutS2
VSFAAGEAVIVVALGRRGEVVERRGQLFRVAVGALTLSCRAAELRPVTSPASSSRPSRKRLPTHRNSRTDAPAVRPSEVTGRDTASSIDLHGMTTLEAREALLRHLDAAMRAGHARVEVVHGIGTGKVRQAALSVLTAIPSVRQVRPHPTNRGVTVVEF